LDGQGVEEIGGDGLYATEVSRGTASEAEDLPSARCQKVGKIVADDTGNSGDKCSRWHSSPWNTLFLFDE
jgi:hypothetical protein